MYLILQHLAVRASATSEYILPSRLRAGICLEKLMSAPTHILHNAGGQPYPLKLSSFHHKAAAHESISSYSRFLVLATGPGNPPTVRVCTTNTGQLCSRPCKKPDPLPHGGPNPDPHPSTCGFRRVWLAPSVPISGSAFRVSHLWSHSDMLLLLVKY